jgi:hypothetical protein
VISDVELSRVANALSTTLKDQRPERLELERVQAIADGAVGGERKLTARRGTAAPAELVGEEGDVLIRIERREDSYVALRTTDAKGSDWAVPR